LEQKKVESKKKYHVCVIIGLLLPGVSFGSATIPLTVSDDALLLCPHYPLYYGNSNSEEFRNRSHASGFAIMVVGMVL